MKKIYTFIIAISFIMIARSQSVGVGTNKPDSSAMLEVASTTKGFLPPRIDSIQRNAIVKPAVGLIIYNTSVNAFQVYNGKAWYSTVHYIGEAYGGGIVFYVYDNGQHGLIAGTDNANAGFPAVWYNHVDNINTRAKADGIGAGLKNTAIIIAILGPAYDSHFAAAACNEYSVTVGDVTYGDWYLPSKYELNLLYLKKSVVGNSFSQQYWSSTEDTTEYAWAQIFDTGSQDWTPKEFSIFIRAIRAF